MGKMGNIFYLCWINIAKQATLEASFSLPSVFPCLCCNRSCRFLCTGWVGLVLVLM